MQQITFVAFILLCLGISSGVKVSLRKRYVEFIAETYNEAGEPETFIYPSRQAGRVAVDEKRRLVYSVAPQRISVLKILRNKTFELLHTEDFDDIIMTSAQTCKGFLIVAVRNLTDAANSRVFVFRGFSKKVMENLQLLHSIPIDADPQELLVTRDCRRIIVAKRGFVEDVAGDELEGSLAVITFDKPIIGSPIVKRLSFSAFAGEVPRLESEFFVLDKSVSFEEALEPYGICLNKKETEAYITLRDNNGMAVVDFRRGRERVTQLKGLGLKDWSVEGGTQGFDGSRSPQEARLRNAPIFATYSPAQLACQTINKMDFTFLAGSGIGLDTFRRLAQFTLEPGFPPDIQTPGQFGNLRIYGLSSLTDPDGDNMLDLIVSGGPRSFTLVSGDNLTVEADTGSNLELRTMSTLKYNSIATSTTTILQNFDQLSITNGPSPEAVITRRICKGRYILMIGSAKRPGHLFAYTLDTRNLQAGFEFQDRVDGIEQVDGILTNDELYEARQLYLQSPEGLSFVSGRRSGGRLMLVSGSLASGTVELFDLRISCKKQRRDDTPKPKW